MLKKRLFEYERVRCTAKRLKALKVPLHNAKAYGINYLNKLKSGPWQGTREHLGSVFSWPCGLASRIAGRLESSRLGTPILPPVGCRREFAEMLVLQETQDQMEPRPQGDTVIYISLLVVIGCVSAICMHFFFSSQG